MPGSPLACLPENYFFGGAMVSLADFATRNFTTVFALILMASPVCGLRPMRALRSAFTSRPMPGITNTPFFLVSFMAVSASRSKSRRLLVGQFELLGHLPGKCGLGQSCCHVMFSFGCCCLVSRRSPSSVKRVLKRPLGECDLSRFLVLVGNALRQRLHENPVFMRVLENPVVRNNAALCRPKSR